MKEKYLIKDINYRIYGEGKDAVLLHGWGQSIYSMLPIAHLLKGYRCLVIDLPGFGDSAIPSTLLTIKDYAHLVHRLCLSLNINPELIIGHSFGGKVAYSYATFHPVKYLVLTGPSIKKPYKSLWKKSKICVYKLLKKFNKSPRKRFQKILNKLGSKDYQNSHGIMRRIMVSAVNTYFDDTFESYYGKVLLVYGSNDKVTPLKEGKKIKEKMNDATLKVINKGDHFAYLEKRYTFIRLIEEFVGSESIC